MVMLRFYCAAVTHDWLAWLKNTSKNVAYLARYGKQQIEHVEHWPVSKILHYASYVAEIVHEENKAAKPRK